MKDRYVSKKTASPDKENTTPSSGYVVGIGTSAGGLDALKRFFHNVPTDSGLTFVILQHFLFNSFEIIKNILSRHTQLPIYQVDETTTISLNSIYLIPPRSNVILSGNTLQLIDQDSFLDIGGPIDFFFRSLALSSGAQSVGVILSGTGKDGTRGIRYIHEAGGFVVVQDVNSAEFETMPRCALATGLPDVVVEPEHMPTSILSHIPRTNGVKLSLIHSEKANFDNQSGVTQINLKQGLLEPFIYPKLSSGSVGLLEQELTHTRTHLQDVVKRLESINDDLERSNVELQRTNDSLRGANQELCKVNAQYQRKIDELSQFMTETEQHKIFTQLQEEVETRRKVESSLQASEARYRAVVNTQKELICRYLSDDLTITFVNQAYCAYFGKGEEELLGHCYLTLIPTDDHQCIQQQMHALAMDRQPIVYENQVVDVAGDVRWQEWTYLAVVNDEDGDSAEIQASGHDITQRKKNEEMIRALNAELTLVNQELSARANSLEQANRELAYTNEDLDHFAHIASHDLKEPLRGLLNYATFLSRGYLDKLDEKGQLYVASIQQLGKRMEVLIEDLRVYSRIGRAEVAAYEVDLDKILTDIIRGLGPLLAENQIEIRRPIQLPKCRCSPAYAQIIFQNLITNAAKYNDKQDKWIEVGMIEDSMPPIFYVKDNGIGVPQQHFDKIFDIFKRLHPSNRYGGGTGAGLAIVKKIIEQQGGSIWLESEKGEGTTFYFQSGMITQ